MRFANHTLLIVSLVFILLALGGLLTNVKIDTRDRPSISSPKKPTKILPPSGIENENCG